MTALISEDFLKEGKEQLNKTVGTEKKMTEGNYTNEAFHVLLVDDEYLIRSIVPKALTALGIRVDVAENGRQAQEKILSGSYDLVITDINMPEMNGLELLLWLKKHRPHIEGILMSGYDTTNRPFWEQLGGTTEFLSKPFPMVKLHEAVRRSMSRIVSREEKNPEKKV